MCGYCLLVTARCSMPGCELVRNSPDLLPLCILFYTLHMEHGKPKPAPGTDDKHGGEIHVKHLV